MPPFFLMTPLPFKISLKVTFKDILKGRGVVKKKGGMIMDESMAHEGAESMAMEAKETKMEKKGWK